MNTNLNEFDLDKKIDPNQLDIEVCRQPELFYKWARRAVEARMEVDQAKNKYEITVASVQCRVRTNPSSFSIDKVTEAAVSAAVQLNKEVAEALDNINEAKRISGLMDAAVNCMEMKKRMLETLVTLHGQQYFAGPSVPRNLPEIWAKHVNSGKKELDEKQAKKTRTKGE